MRLGVDFGTTRIVVAVVDRGNYPVVAFDGPDGSSHGWYPPLVAVRDGERRYGFDAWAAQEDATWTVCRSLKRLLADAGLGVTVELGGETVRIHDLLVELAGALKRDLLEHSTVKGGEPIEIMLGVPANANTNQRFLTADAFRRAGFDVLGLLNEPSAASIEYGHLARQGAQPPAGSAVLVYDFGGGTFDVSLVELDARIHRVLASEGIPTLGGDDFDHVLGELALARAGLGEEDRASLSQADYFRLEEECRQKKEGLHPNTRRLLIDLEAINPAWREISLPVADYYEACGPLVDETITLAADLLEQHGLGGEAAEAGLRLDAVYAIGGASELPLVARRLRERFGRRVRRSPHARSATAIGLAIQADAQSGYVLRDRFTRYFGVWREADHGRLAVFDPLFEKGTPLPAAGEPALETGREYQPAHNVGHYRYLECSQVEAEGCPAGDITIWDEIRFPFDPGLADRTDLDGVPVERTAAVSGQTVAERYRCDGSGAVTVELANVSAGYARAYQLARWAPQQKPMRPVRKRPRTAGGRARSSEVS